MASRQAGLHLCKGGAEILGVWAQVLMASWQKQLLTSCKSLWSMLPASMPKASDKIPAVALRSGVSSWAETAMKRVSNCSITRIFSGMLPPKSSLFSAHLQSRSRHQQVTVAGVSWLLA